MTVRWLPVAVAAATLLGCTSGPDDSAATNPSSVSTNAPTGPSTTVSSSGAVSTLPEGVGGEATGPLGSTELRVETDAGTVQIGSGSVPERLASGFPLPSDLVVQLSSETATDLGVSGTTELAFEELIELYETGLPAAGYTIVSVNRRGDEFAVFDFENDDGLGQVAISKSAGTGGFTVIVAFADGGETQPEN
jgi:hypothetical protein